MTPDRWSRIKDIFADALDRQEPARASFLDGACGSDADLLAQVERLLAQAGATLKSPAIAFVGPAQSLTTGEMLAQYRVESKIGQGGMGSVYRAYDTRLQRPVALKLLPPGQFAGEERRERLMSEARAASALNHPNIVTVYEIGSGEGIDFIAMEFVDGHSLAHLIPGAGLPLKRALNLAIEIAGGLAQAHAAGVVHRDLKPANIMVNAVGHVKLLDFGLAQRSQAGEQQSEIGTGEREIAGTPAYMAPEQAEGLKSDARADVFSFGAVLYEMLTGRRPFSGSSSTSMMASVLRDDPDPITGVPAELEKLVGRCLRKDPSRRFQHMGDVRILLEDLVQELDTAKPKPVMPPPSLVAPVAKRSHWAILSACGLLAVGSVFVYWSVHSVSQMPPPVQTVLEHAPPTAASNHPAPPPEAGRSAADERARAKVQRPAPATQQEPPELAPAVSVTLVPYSGLLRDPTFSPDGKRIAFGWDGAKGGNADIYVTSDGIDSSPLRLTTSTDTEAGATWSPHGTQIAFRRLTGAIGIYMVPPTGGIERKIADAGALFDETLPHMSWTPDGNWIAAPDRSGKGPTEIFLYSVHSPEKWQLTWNASGIDHAPAISPDGRYLAYASCAAVARCEVVVMALDRGFKPTGLPQRLTSQGGYIRGISWMRDSRRLVYSAGAVTGLETYLWRVSVVPPGAPERLDLAGNRVRHPVVAPRGDRLVYARFDSNVQLARVGVQSAGRALALIENFR